MFFIHMHKMVFLLVDKKNLYMNKELSSVNKNIRLIMIILIKLKNKL